MNKYTKIISHNTIHKINFNDIEGKTISYIGMAKRQIEDRIIEHKRDIHLHKSSYIQPSTCTSTARLNNKSPIKLYFNNVGKLAGHKRLNYALLWEDIEIITANSKICNDIHHMLKLIIDCVACKE